MLVPAVSDVFFSHSRKFTVLKLMRDNKPPTYIKFLQSLHQTTEEQLAEFSLYLKENTLNNFIFKESPHCMYLHDYSRMSYPFVSANSTYVTGHRPEEFLEGGTSFLLHIFHPDDMRVFNEEVFKTMLATLASVPIAEHKHYRFSINYRLRRLDGSYKHVLQQGTFLHSDPQGRPLFNFAMATDISDYKTDSRIILKVERMREDGETQLIFTKNYFPDPDEERLTKKELEVLKWVLEGLNSQEIADKMYTSVHTIKTHRKHMLQKTNAKNSADLIRYAVSRGLLQF